MTFGQNLKSNSSMKHNIPVLNHNFHLVEGGLLRSVLQFDKS